MDGGTIGLFDIDERLQRLSDLGDQLLNPNALSVAPFSRKYSNLSLPSSGVGMCPAGTHHSAMCGCFGSSNQCLRSRKTWLWPLL